MAVIVVLRSQRDVMDKALRACVQLSKGAFGVDKIRSYRMALHQE